MDVVFLCIPSLVLLVLGVLYGIRGLHEARIRRQLGRDGVDTEAVVTGHWMIGTPRSGNTYYVGYRFRAWGEEYEHEEQVGLSKYRVWNRGTLIPVRYLPQDPSLARITSEKNYCLFIGMALVVCSIGLVLVFTLLFL